MTQSGLEALFHSKDKLILIFDFLLIHLKIDLVGT